MRDALRLRASAGPWEVRPDTADELGFVDAVVTALAIERRVRKGIAGRSDLRRFHLASETIERIAADSFSEIGVEDLVLEAQSCIPFLAAAADAGGNDPGLVRGFFTPAQAAKVADLEVALPEPLITPWRAFWQQVRAHGHGVVAIYEADSGDELIEATGIATRLTATRGDVGKAPNQAEQVRSRAAAIDFFAGQPRREAIARKMRDAIAGALEEGTPLIVGSQTHHEVLPEAFRDVVDVNGAAVLRISYVDGSEAQPFPVGGWRSARSVRGKHIRLGLMSMRHTELDPDVGGYWFRNYLVSTTRAMAETDDWCTAHSEYQLKEFSKAGINSFEIVQTGFEPAVVGFYRAVARWLQDVSRPPIAVTPVYKRGHAPEVLGRPWSRAQR